MSFFFKQFFYGSFMWGFLAMISNFCFKSVYFIKWIGRFSSFLLPFSILSHICTAENNLYSLPIISKVCWTNVSLSLINFSNLNKLDLIYLEKQRGNEASDAWFFFLFSSLSIYFFPSFVIFVCLFVCFYSLFCLFVFSLVCMLPCLFVCFIKALVK